MKNIANIINFVRAVEPREEDDSYLLSTFEEELKLCCRHGFESTALLQYDAMIKDEYQQLIWKYEDLLETGLWLEIVQPLVEDSGLEWRGRFPWDWHNDVGFTVGYTPQERTALIDTAFEKFREIFGEYPAVVGSWHIDAFSLNYMYEKYGIVASCNCRDQYGTDGYTIWGGYYNGGYYPSKNNMLCPAQTAEGQINVPVFRMLGPDPIYQYDMGLGNPEKSQGVCSLEPVYEKGGGCPEWVDWYFRENFNGKCLSHAYTQLGQENSFGWDKISKGLPMQFEKLAEKIEAGEIELMTLGEAGRQFRESFRETPPAATCIESDYAGNGYKTLWYSCKNYRINLLYRDGEVWIRDFHIFDEKYKERFLSEKDTEPNCGYYNLPVMDGFRFSKDGIRAGIYIGGKEKDKESEFFCEISGDKIVIVYVNPVKLVMTEESVSVVFADDNLYLDFVTADAEAVPYVSADEKILHMHFGGYDGNAYDYCAEISKGRFEYDEHGLRVMPEDNEVIFKMTK